MIKKRLIGLLPHAGKHIIYHILLQILALIAQIVLVFTLANVIEEAVGGVLDRDAILIAIITFVVVYIIRVSCEELEAKESYLAGDCNFFARYRNRLIGITSPCCCFISHRLSTFTFVFFKTPIVFYSRNIL